MKKNFRTWLNFLLIAGFVMILASSCKKDNDTDDPTQSGTVNDIDGNVYTTVTIGTQVWMVENLKTTKYRNGDPIPNVTDNTQWSSLTTGAHCNYNNEAAIGNKYGRLYNWHAVNDSRNVAPTGWHVATDAEWTIMEDYLNEHGYKYIGATTENEIAKSIAAKTDWASSGREGAIGNDLTKNNLSGFTALPGGSRYLDGTWDGIGEYGNWWSSTEYEVDYGLNRFAAYSLSDIGRFIDITKEQGLSVRCVKD